MSTKGEMTVADALSFAGRVVEATGNNDGPQIEAMQREAEIEYAQSPGTYAGAAWCAIFQGEVARRTLRDWAFGAPQHDLVHPYTGWIARQADAMGGLAPTSQRVPAGTMTLIPGVHVGLVVYDRGNGLLDTVEGNVGNAVRRMVRDKADWRLIVPPDVTASAAPVFVESYGFDDLTEKPTYLGGWTSVSLREAKRAGWELEHPGWWTRPVKTRRPSPYGFWTGPPGTWDDDWGWWEYGGWTAGGDAKQAHAIREDQIDKFAAKHGHRNVRRWMRRVPVPMLGIRDRSGGASSATAPGETSTR